MQASTMTYLNHVTVDVWRTHDGVVTDDFVLENSTEHVTTRDGLCRLGSGGPGVRNSNNGGGCISTF